MAMNYNQKPIQIDATLVPLGSRASSVPTANPIPNYDLTQEVSNLGSDQLKKLKLQGYSTGLAKSLADVKTMFPLRIWIIDNSGSMNKTDGHRLAHTKSKRDFKIVECTRWQEIQESVSYHIQLSALLKMPTSFRLLNNPGILQGEQYFGIANMTEESIPDELTKALDIITKVRPSGVTPLTEHVNHIHEIVSGLSTSLQSEGRKVVVVIATDGLPTDSYGNANKQSSDLFVESLKMLERLPVWLVIRLCTDETEVVEFYNSLDDKLELSMDVLDDFVGEAEEVYDHNEWLNYALPLHRMREMGFHDRVFDLLDERSLQIGELRDFCRLLFGVENLDGVPEPINDWDGFLQSIERLLKAEDKQYNPIKKRMMPWIDLNKLQKIYGSGSSCIIS